MLSYLTYKSIHMLGIVVFVGNIIVTGVWKYRADATQRPEVIAFAQRLVALTDWIFTLGGVILILIGGFGMVGVAVWDFARDLGCNPDPDPGRPGADCKDICDRWRDSGPLLVAQSPMVHLGQRGNGAAAAQSPCHGPQKLTGGRASVP
jgi:hypothetical protein